MIHPKHINILDYNYNLPNDRIAKHPVPNRDHSKLLIVKNKTISEDYFYALPNYLPQDALLVFNNTQVIQARLHFTKDAGAHIEVFCLEPFNCSDFAIAFSERKRVEWVCMVGNLKKWKGQTLKQVFVHKGEECILNVNYVEPLKNGHRVCFTWTGNLIFSEVLELCGILPIPPYLHRDTEESDLENYQTVYSKVKGSVAAPTAGLHFTPEMMRKLHTLEVTLHVGAGTFQPVKSACMGEHVMHTEMIQVQQSTIEYLSKTAASIIGVGTTSVRTLESLYWMGCMVIENPNMDMQDLHVSQWYPYDNACSHSRQDALEALLLYLKRNRYNTLFASTEIIIAPGYVFKVIDGIITNFHQPQSTLLLLISAFLKIPFQEVYVYALNHNFRFLSYGDSSLLL